LLFCASSPVLSTTGSAVPASEAQQILWRRIEKGAENLLRRVDGTVECFVKQHRGSQFSTVVTQSHSGMNAISDGQEEVCRGFHRFTAVITTTRFTVLDFKESFLQ
jgi:hypothetical protein